MATVSEAVYRYCDHLDRVLHSIGRDIHPCSWMTEEQMRESLFLLQMKIEEVQYYVDMIEEALDD